MASRFAHFKKATSHPAAPWLGIILIVVALSALPFALAAVGTAWVRITNLAILFAMLSLGLNIVVGFAGLLDLGYIAFYAVGAYAYALLASPQFDLHWPFWVTLPIGAVVAAVFGILLGAPTLKLRGDYLAIVTLGFGEIVPNFFLNAVPLTGGTRGINPIAKPPTLGPFDFGQTAQRNWYWLILGIGLVSIFIILRLYNSRLGRSWQAIREDELAAASMGINLTRTKLWAFALG